MSGTALPQVTQPLREQMRTILVREEGLRLVVYDDKTAKPIGPGTTVQGIPTIGIGRNLFQRGITAAEAYMLCDSDIDVAVTGLGPRIEGWQRLSPTRQAVLGCMAFQLGVRGTLEFRQMLAAVARQDWNGAASAMLDSAWARQTPERAQRMAQLMRQG